MKNPQSKRYGFDLLIKHSQRKMYSIIRRMVYSHEDTNDILQNSLLKAWEHIDSFKGKSSLDTWLYRIATNETLNFLKQKRIHQFISLGLVAHKLEDQIENPLHYEGSEIEKKLQKALLQLPKKQRLVFNLRYFEEMKYEQIAEILGTSVGALKASYHIAEQKIQMNLKKQ
ncbi:MAG: RNA polymerase sigma factor [Bacteroidales bacterium]